MKKLALLLAAVLVLTAGFAVTAYADDELILEFHDLSAEELGSICLPQSGEMYHHPEFFSNSTTLTLSNTSSRHTFIKLYNADDRLVSSVFVREGEKVSIYIPGGEYYLKQAFGTTWVNEKELFGPEGEYWMCTVSGSTTLPLKSGGVYRISTGGGGNLFDRKELQPGNF